MQDAAPTIELAPHFASVTKVKTIRDYTFLYAEIDISVPGTLEITFPRIGYLVLYFLNGADFSMRFLNYHRAPSRLHRFYINGLFSEGSLALSQSGTGGGYALKIHPVIGHYLLKFPLSELTDRQVLLSDALGKDGRLLREMEADLLQRPFSSAYVHRLFEILLPDKSAYRHDPIYRAVNTIRERNGLITVTELCKEFCMSERTLRRQFLLKVGLSPQAYAKIWQVQHAMELIHHHPTATLERIAYEAGYYDVAHLARDFRHKVSFTPAGFEQRRNRLNEHYLRSPSSLQ